MTPRAKKKETRMGREARTQAETLTNFGFDDIAALMVRFAQRERRKALKEAADKAAAFKQCVGEMERNVGAEIERDILALGAKK